MIKNNIENTFNTNFQKSLNDINIKLPKDKFDLNNYWFKLNDNTSILKHFILEDYRAVQSSRTSRSIDYDNRINTDSSYIINFLMNNVKKYNHSSIAEMAFPTIFSKNFGWISAFFLTHDPLFIGQETSTRAIVDLDSYCYEINNDDNKKQLHLKFSEIFKKLSQLKLHKGGYKFDFIRIFLPGSFRTGVCVSMNARSLVRHLKRLYSIKYMKNIVDEYKKGFENCCPILSKCFVINSNKPSMGINFQKRITYTKFNDIFDIKIIGKFNKLIFKKVNELLGYKKREKKTYISSDFKYFGIFTIKFNCTIAAMRDFHRHRTLYPFKFELLSKNKKTFYPIFAPFYKNFLIDIYGEKIIFNLFNRVKKIFNNLDYSKLENSSFDIYDLYMFPLGTMVRVSMTGTLENIIYMLELRSLAHGANFEYQIIAQKIIDKLKLKIKNSKIIEILNL